MTHLHRQKKPGPELEDWHPADIVAGVIKSGWSLAQLSLEHGYSHRGSLGLALRQPYPKAERIIADAIGVKPQVIWPSRYNLDGTTNRLPGRKPLRPSNLPAKGSTRVAGRNPQQKRAG